MKVSSDFVRCGLVFVSCYIFVCNYLSRLLTVVFSKTIR